ncbi:MAG: 2-amino-4-hydroxy-6-hydroxymethyldihydropteridine diphosphokinase [Pseudomonadota bacterium]
MGRLQRVYIALGANRTYRRRPLVESLIGALKALEGPAIRVIAASRPWRTPAWPDPRDPQFLNAAAELRTDLSADDLLTVLHGVEERLGRVRGERNAPRTLDLDLLDHGGRVSADGDQTITPHPRLHLRAFVLAPLREIAPRWRLPGEGTPITRLYAALPSSDRRAVRPAGPPLIRALRCSETLAGEGGID